MDPFKICPRSFGTYSTFKLDRKKIGDVGAADKAAIQLVKVQSCQLLVSETLCLWAVCAAILSRPESPTLLEQRKGRVQRGPLAKRIPFYNMRYDNGAEQKLFQTLSGRIQEITAIFGTIPDFIVDQWVTDMLDDKEWDENTILTVIAEREQNPFTLKETIESLDADWDSTAEVLNQADAMRMLLSMW